MNRQPQRRLFHICAVLSAIALVAVAVLAVRLVPPAPPAPALLTLTPVDFADLDGWAEDDHAAALTTFLRSCARMVERPQTVIATERAAWLELCTRATAVDIADPIAARRFFEAGFRPHEMRYGPATDGLLTGYYEPELDASTEPTETYDHPLHVLPPDLVTIDLGRFAADLAGRQITGRIEGRSVVPYLTRAEIAGGALAGRELELFWVSDPVAAFFLEIQGSGRLRLPDDSVIRVGYAGKNGHPYTAIGRVLVDMGALGLEDVSLESIRDWLKANPEQAEDVMNVNQSYVFFRAHGEDGPFGSEGVVLTPGRSLAVDRRHTPMGTPIWIDGKMPAIAGGGALRRLTIAQDTGGAIVGGLRGDLFWGPGLEAEELAGHMRDRARFYTLRPRALDGGPGR